MWYVKVKIFAIQVRVNSTKFVAKVEIFHKITIYYIHIYLRDN